MSTARWHDRPGTYTGVVVLTVAALPLVLQTVWSLVTQADRSRQQAGGAWRTSVADVGIVYGTVPWVWLTMLPGQPGG